jgi:hypothetical protein
MAIEGKEQGGNNPGSKRTIIASLSALGIERLRSMRDELSSRLQTCECCNAPSVKAGAENKKESV